MAADVWRNGDTAILIGDDGSYEKIVVCDRRDGLARVQIIGCDDYKLVDPALIFSALVLQSEKAFELATASRQKRLLLSEAARLTGRNASDTNLSIYNDERRGRVIAIRAGGAREACYNPAALILRYELQTGDVSRESPLWRLYDRDPRPFRNYFEKLRALHPSGNFQIWGEEHGSDVV